MDLFLNILIAENYLFHGSTKLINYLTPQKPIDLNKRQGNEVGIYFTFNPEVAKFNAITGGLVGKKYISTIGGFKK